VFGPHSSASFYGGRAAAFEDDVELVAECSFGLGGFEVEGRDHALLGFGVAHGLVDRVLTEERVAGEVHLRDETATESLPEEREVYVGWAPGVVVVLPRVGPGFTVTNLSRPSSSVRHRPAPEKFGSSGAGCLSRWWV
jgi:hypothetical protein